VDSGNSRKCAVHRAATLLPPGQGRHDQSNVFHGREGFDACFLPRSRESDLGTLAVRRESVADPNRDSSLNHWLQGLWMKHLRSKVRQSSRLPIRNLWNCARVGNQAGIGSEEAIDIGPDDDFVGTKRSSDNGGRIIRATATQCG